mmetsp:Transcript_19370/g.40340  ORF Transcript_19370/g.40340 Transcript_19370/m.40340 type:complete len:533 (-) Transcript_19370:257-1855(-)
MPSHPVAVAKLALCLADAGHEVTIAAPAGDAVKLTEKAVKDSPTPIRIVAAGHTSTTKHLNVHGSADANSWRHMVHCLCHPIAQACANAADLTSPMFGPLLKLMQAEPRPDVVVLSHYVCSPAGDAAELAGLPAVTFVHLPYDPAIFMGDAAAWKYPRMLPSFPHVSSYPTVPPTGWRGLSQLAWKWFDAKVSAMHWSRAAKRQNAVRALRGLPLTCAGGWAGYIANHPAVVLGGPPFGPPAPVPPLATVVGHVEPKTSAELSQELASWLEMNPAGTVFISMGTGQILDDSEARELARGLGRRLASLPDGPNLLWALRASEQERLCSILHQELGRPEASRESGALHFFGGKVRVEGYVRQPAVLSSGRVCLFISHMGFGACTEGVSAGVPFVSYPGGFDQEFNATRAEEMGFAVRAPRGLVGIEDVVRRALADKELAGGARRAQRQLAAAGGGQAAVRAVEHFAFLGREGAAALRLPFATHGGGEKPRHRPTSCGASKASSLPIAAVALGALLSLLLLLLASLYAAQSFEEA